MAPAQPVDGLLEKGWKERADDRPATGLDRHRQANRQDFASGSEWHRVIGEERQAVADKAGRKRRLAGTTGTGQNDGSVAGGDGCAVQHRDQAPIRVAGRGERANERPARDKRIIGRLEHAAVLGHVIAIFPMPTFPGEQVDRRQGFAVQRACRRCHPGERAGDRRIEAAHPDRALADLQHGIERGGSRRRTDRTVPGGRIGSGRRVCRAVRQFGLELPG